MDGVMSEVRALQAIGVHSRRRTASFPAQAKLKQPFCSDSMGLLATALEYMGASTARCEEAEKVRAHIFTLALVSIGKTYPPPTLKANKKARLEKEALNFSLL